MVGEQVGVRWATTGPTTRLGVYLYYNGSLEATIAPAALAVDGGLNWTCCGAAQPSHRATGASGSPGFGAGWRGGKRVRLVSWLTAAEVRK